MNALTDTRHAREARSGGGYADVIARKMGAPPSGLTIGKRAAKTSSTPSTIWRSSAVMRAAWMRSWKRVAQGHARLARQFQALDQGAITASISAKVRAMSCT